jgi:neprosin-like protein
MASNGIQDFRSFVESLLSARHEDLALRPDAKAQGPQDFEDMRQHVLGLYTGVEAQHSFIELGGHVVDCIPIEQQPALRNTGGRLLPPGPPPELPPLAERLTADGPPLRPARQLHPDWKDRYGNAMWCPSGTIPMRRVTLEQITRFRTLNDFFSKAPGGGSHPSFGGPADVVHKYAHAAQFVDNVGGGSFNTIFAPTCGTTANDFSLSQQWWSNGNPATNNLQTVEGGWQVYPYLWQTPLPCLFIFYTNANYTPGSGCYNLLCPAFVQAAGHFVLGGALESDGFSLDMVWTFWGDRWQLWTRYVSDDDGFLLAGYYPVSIFRGGPMSTGANYLDVGGETSGDGVWPPMGCGNKPPNRLVAVHGGVSYGPKSGGPWRGLPSPEKQSPHAMRSR